MSKPGKHAISAVSPLLLASLPKCPACLLFLLAPLGISFPAAGPVLTSAALLLLAVPLVYLALPACRGCSKRPLYLAIAGTLLMAAGRFAATGPALPIAGALVIFTAVWWGRRPVHAHR